jgi:hypothetical protein
VTTALHHPGLVPALVAAIGAVAVVWLAFAVSGWRRITWREHMDAPVSLLPRQARRGEGWAEGRVLTRQHEEVTNPSLVLLRVRNSGFATVREADIRRPISFTFPGREVKEFSVTDCRKVTRQMIQPPGMRDASIVDNRIYLPRFPLKRRASFKLLVLLSGTDRGVFGKGRLRRGSVVRESLRRGPLASPPSTASTRSTASPPARRAGTRRRRAPRRGQRRSPPRRSRCRTARRRRATRPWSGIRSRSSSSPSS